MIYVTGRGIEAFSCTIIIFLYSNIFVLNKHTYIKFYALIGLCMGCSYRNIVFCIYGVSDAVLNSDVCGLDWQNN